MAIDSVDKAKLLINIIRGTDVPVRKSYYHSYQNYLAQAKETAGGDQKAYQQLYLLKQVETFIEIRLVD